MAKKSFSHEKTLLHLIQKFEQHVYRKFTYTWVHLFFIYFLLSAQSVSISQAHDRMINACVLV